MSGIMCALAGSGGDTAVTLEDASVYSVYPVLALATFGLASDRTAYSETDAGGVVYEYDWLASYASPSNYEVRATFVDGALFSGTLDTWLSLSSNHEWAARDPADDAMPVFAVILLEVRNALTTIVLDSATITLTAERS